jgi:hypothetical protein
LLAIVATRFSCKTPLLPSRASHAPTPCRSHTLALPCGSGLARDSGNAVFLQDPIAAIAGKPRSHTLPLPNLALPCGSGLARDRGNAVFLQDPVAAIAGKPRSHTLPLPHSGNNSCAAPPGRTHQRHDCQLLIELSWPPRRTRAKTRHFLLICGHSRPKVRAEHPCWKRSIRLKY